MFLLNSTHTCVAANYLLLKKKRKKCDIWQKFAIIYDIQLFCSHKKHHKKTAYNSFKLNETYTIHWGTKLQAVWLHSLAIASVKASSTFWIFYPKKWMKTLFNAIFTYRINIIYTYFHCISPAYSNECGALLKRCTETNILLIGLFFFFLVYLVLKNTIICVYTKKTSQLRKNYVPFPGGFLRLCCYLYKFFWERLLCVLQIQRFFSVKWKLSSH